MSENYKRKTAKLNQRQERFCLEYFTTRNAKQSAITAGYSKKTAVSIASENLTKPDIVARLRELQEATATDKIATVIKRKELLTEIANEEHEDPIKAGERIRAIAELNKMDRLYAPEIDQRVVNITVMSEEGKKNLERILEGEGT